MRNVEADVNNTEVVNHYSQKGVSSGATAGIAVLLFIIGAAIAAVVVAVLMLWVPKKSALGRYQELDV
ncbi:hypothetical protein ABL78_8454 [Leptomonas seymouri]|uniref:Uncharacterized protein n=1 Tax=Leptomonas seymouri TaxID=5684 RepID=A0A0N0P248_LEPSE|nr:hypothetical protein ABL78_8454 [Leptomonas seymouri]|eukprot:KPI82536.1 hypothetical protein ABL78_8454 [Leptomonas seymouri]